MNNHKKEYILQVAALYDVPKQILLGIYHIETTYRRLYHRIAENTLVIFGVFASMWFGYHVKNFTIGCCQIGLTTILSLNGERLYRHSLKTPRLNFMQIKMIISAMLFKQNVKLCALLAREMVIDELMKTSNIHDAWTSIGQRYNGTYVYGLMLERFCNDYITEVR